MLVVEFSVGVQKEHVDEVLDKIDNLGIQPTRQGNYTHPLFVEEPIVYVDCFGPLDRVKSLCEQLNKANYQVLFSY